MWGAVWIAKFYSLLSIIACWYMYNVWVSQKQSNRTGPEEYWNNTSYYCADELHGTNDPLKMMGVWKNFVWFQPLVFMSYTCTCINLVPREEWVHYQLSASPQADNDQIPLMHQVDIHVLDKYTLLDKYSKFQNKEWKFKWTLLMYIQIKLTTTCTFNSI